MTETDGDGMDGIDLEDGPMIDEDELLGLFGRRRPVAETFRAGVDRRIEERGGADEAAGEDRSEVWGRAAGLAPGMIGGGATAALKGAGAAKGGASFLLLPVAAVAGVVGVFAFGARSLGRDAAAVTPGLGEPEDAVNARFGRTANIVWWSMLALVILAPTALGTDLLIAWLCVTMLSLVHGVRLLAGAGLLDRPRVRRVILAAVALPLLQIAIQGHPQGVSLPTSDLGPGAGFWLIVMGWAVMEVLTPSGHRWKVLLAFTALFALLNSASLTYSGPRGLRLAAGRVSLDSGDLHGWEQVGVAHAALVAAGEETFDTSGIQREVRRALASPGLDVHPQVWSAALDMGLLGIEELQQLARREGVEPPRRAGAEMYVNLNPTYYYRYRVPAMVAAHDLDGEQREALATELLSSWPEPETHGALNDALYVVRGLETLGRDDLVEGLRGAALEIMETHWVAPRRFTWLSRKGGFTSDPRRFETSFADETLRALELMERYGPPAGVDLRWVQAFLREDASAFTAFDVMPSLKLESRAALLRLRREVGLPGRSWLGVLLGERYALALLLCIGLGALALSLAPEEVPPARAGAQP